MSLNGRMQEQADPVGYIEERFKNTGMNKVSERKRISRDQMFMSIALIVAERGTCDRARVGAVLVDPNKNIVSIGYNGSPSGEQHCEDAGHIMYNGHCIRTVHAEQNCIDKVELLKEGQYTMYVTHYPCAKCQIALYEKLMGNPYTKMKVIYNNGYNNTTAFQDIIAVQEVLQFSHFES